MTKKGKILKIFNDAEWQNSNTSSFKRSKTLTYEMFRNAGLQPTMEYDESYNDIIYARNIFREMGYKIGIGMAFHIYEL